MNKNLHRIIFNAARGSRMVVQETATSAGKGTRQATVGGGDAAGAGLFSASLSALYLGVLLMGLGVDVSAQIVADPNAPGNQRPTVLLAPNGVPLVNLQTPSAAGVSRNTYSQFDVQNNGAILNNGRNNTQTQLGGWVQGNPWLARGSARVIVNEVNSSNPSQLRGFVEVAGQRAEVIIANPAGIQVDGGGFLNATRSVLTTGTPQFNANGGLDSFLVQRGSVSVNGAGLDMRQSDYSAILARAVELNAGVWAKDLKVVTGANQISADAGQIAPVAGTGPAPAFALDVAHLGGMYAGKIVLVGTEAGLGVRNAGQIGASAGEVIVTADGLLQNSGRITSSGDTRIDTQGGIANSGTVYAEGDAHLSTRGNIANTRTGTIAAQGNAALAATGAASRIDSQTGSVLAAGVTGDGTLAGSGALQLNATGQLVAQGRNLAAGDLTAAAAGIDVSGSQTRATNLRLTAASGDLDASNATLLATQTLDASAAGTLRTDGQANLSAERLQLAAHDLSNRGGELLQTGTADQSIRVAGNIDNTGGRIASNAANLNLGAQTLTNTGAVSRIEHAGAGTLAIDANTLAGAGGSISSNGALQLDARTATLDGGKTIAGNIRIASEQLSNRGGTIIQTGSGATTIDASTRLDNTGGSIASNGDTTLKAGSLVNKGGTIQAASSADLVITASGGIDNSALANPDPTKEAIKGQIGAGGALSIQAASLANTGSQITAGDTLDIQTGGALDNTQGLIAANQDVTLAAGTLTNRAGRIGSVQGGTSVNARSGALDNSAGRIEAAKAVSVAGLGIANAGGIVVGQDLLVSSGTQALNNRGGTVAARGTLDVRSGALDNDAGMLSAGGAMNIDTQGQKLANTNSGSNGGILGQSSVTLKTGELDNAAGFIGARGDLKATATGAIGNTAGGQITGEKTIALAGTGLDNQGGTLQALGDVGINVGGGSVNNAGIVQPDGVGAGSLIRSGGTLGIDAGSVINTDTLDQDHGLEGQSVALRADTVGNQRGGMRADQKLAVTGAGQIDNSQGLMSAGQALTIQDRDLANKNQTLTNTGGTAIAGNQLAIDSAGVTGDGKLLSRGDLSMALARDFTNSGTVQANRDLTLSIPGKVVNQSLIQAGGKLAVSGADIDNQAPGEISAAQTRVKASGTLTNRGLIDGEDTFVEAGTLNNVGTGRIYGDHVAIEAGTLGNDVENGIAAVIAARNRLDIGAQTITNREHALIFSGTDMSIGGAIDRATGKATGQAQTLNNNSASIEALGDLKLAVRNINNTNEHFSTEVQQVGNPEHIVEYQAGGGLSQRYREGADGVYTYYDESEHLMTPEGAFESWVKFDYTRTTTATTIKTSDPGSITSGGAMDFVSDAILNDKSRIVAGGDATGTAGKLTNTEEPGKLTNTDVGVAISNWRDHKKGRDDTGRQTNAYLPTVVPLDIKLTPSVYLENTAPPASGTQIAALGNGAVAESTSGVGPATVNIGPGRAITPQTQVPSIQAPGQNGPSMVVRTGGVNTALPNNALFHVNANPGAGYLVETDPRFASYRNWLSSDYMLTALGVDPANLHKRLGDGFYEQKLIREQVAELTGRRFLDGYGNDEAQYRALIENGVTLAKQWQLVPGVALSAAQMAQLTSDIVWLVEQSVTLPDGRVTRALVPQVYVRVKEGDIDGSGALISARAIDLNLDGDLVNQGTLAGRDIVSLNAQNIANLGGRITGGDVDLRARTDLSNLGGIIDATNNLSALAGRDLTVASTTRSASNAQGSATQLNRIAGLYITGSEAKPDGGLLIAAAGRDFTLAGAQVGNAAKEGNTLLAAGRDLNLSTVDTSRQDSIAWDAKNRRSESQQQEIGSSIQTSGDLRLQAGRDLSARGANVSSSDGSLVATAKRDINITAAQSSSSVDEAHQHTGKTGGLAKKTITTEDQISQTTSQASTFSGKTTTVQAERDIRVTGSNIVSDQGTTLAAKRDITIEAATNTLDESHLRDEKKKGLFGTGGVGFTYGVQQQSQDNRGVYTTAAASTVGSTEGNVRIQAGNNYRQEGSNVLAPQGDIDIRARKVDIVEARETGHATQESKFSQSGLTVAVTAPVISAIQTASQMKSAAGQTDDKRMQALAAGTTALAAKNAVDAVGKDADYGGGINISITVGASKSETKQTQDANHGAGSTVAAGGNVSIRAEGAGKDSSLTVQGSNISAGNDALLKADGDVNLLAARNSDEMQRKSSSQSGAVGVAISVGSGGVGVGVTASASASRGKGEGSDTTYTNTHVDAGNKLKIESGGDLNMKGAVASGKQVIADVGGNLNIESLQDTSVYKSKDQSIGGSVTAGAGFSASVNASQQKVDSNYASVNEQSGIKAGDDGFQVKVKGNTDLKGGAITSTEKAIDEGKNSLSTATLTHSDIENKADYKASSVAIGGGYSTGGGGMKCVANCAPGNSAAGGGVGTNQQGEASTAGAGKVPGSDLPTGKNGASASTPIVSGAKGDASSSTRSGISGAKIEITDESKQKEKTGQDAEQTVASINRGVSTEQDTTNALKPIFDDKKKKEIEAGFEISGAFQRETGVFLNNQAKKADDAKKAARQAQNDPNATPEQRAALQQKADELEQWGPGGNYRIIVTAVTGGITGNITGSGSQMLQSTAVNYLQSLGTNQVKLIADQLDSEPARAALQAVVACGGAAATGNSCGAGAAGAAASVVLNNLLNNLDNQKAGEMSAGEKENRANLVTSIVAGITALAGGDAAVAGTAARIETENNHLGTGMNIAGWQLGKNQVKQFGKDLKSACAGADKTSCNDAYDKWRDISYAQGGLLTPEDRAGWENAVAAIYQKEVLPLCKGNFACEQRVAGDMAMAMVINAGDAAGLRDTIKVATIAGNIDNGNWVRLGLQAAGDAALVGQLGAMVNWGKGAGVVTEAGEEVAGSIRNVNPGYPAPGRTHNCVNCSIATDATLAGNPASALPINSTKGVPINVLEKQYGAKFSGGVTPEIITTQMADAGPGAQGIVFGSYGPGQPGHVFNVVNQNGVIRFLDGQTGKAANLDNFKSLQLLRTN